MKKPAPRPRRRVPEVWVARLTHSVEIFTGSRPKVTRSGPDWYRESNLDNPSTYEFSLCWSRFKRMTGIKLKPGEVRRLRVTVEKPARRGRRKK